MFIRFGCEHVIFGSIMKLKRGDLVRYKFQNDRVSGLGLVLGVTDLAYIHWQRNQELKYSTFWRLEVQKDKKWKEIDWDGKIK
jgi:hypothetical protein